MHDRIYGAQPHLICNPLRKPIPSIISCTKPTCPAPPKKKECHGWTFTRAILLGLNLQSHRQKKPLEHPHRNCVEQHPQNACCIYDQNAFCTYENNPKLQHEGTPSCSRNCDCVRGTHREPPGYSSMRRRGEDCLEPHVCYRGVGTATNITSTNIVSLIF